MTDADIADTIEAYGRAAAAAEATDFDGIEIHAAHGYLIDQFFWFHSNTRTDRWGGDPSARARFGAEIVRACRARVGDDFPVGLRFSQWKLPNYYDTRLVDTSGELESFSKAARGRRRGLLRLFAAPVLGAGV